MAECREWLLIIFWCKSSRLSNEIKKPIKLKSRPKEIPFSQDVWLSCAAEPRDTINAKTFLGIWEINELKNLSQVRKDSNATCGLGNPSGTGQQKARNFMPLPSTLTAPIWPQQLLCSGKGCFSATTPGNILLSAHAWASAHVENGQLAYGAVKSHHLAVFDPFACRTAKLSVVQRKSQHRQSLHPTKGEMTDLQP